MSKFDVFKLLIQSHGWKLVKMITKLKKLIDLISQKYLKATILTEKSIWNEATVGVERLTIPKLN